MKIKTCVHCHVEKSISEFHTKGNEKRVNSWCKTCVYTLQKNRWIDRKIKIIEMLGGKCNNCGYNKNFAAMHFHHVDPSKKEYNWSRLRQVRWDRLIQEMKKCILFCSNCHAEHHNPHLETTDVVYREQDNRLLNGNGFISNKHKYSIISNGMCPVCNNEVYSTKYCSAVCAHVASRKVKWPDKNTLYQKLKTMSLVSIGKEYGVSDNAVRKWARKYHLV